MTAKPQQEMTPQQAVTHAAQLIASSRLAEAEALLRKVLAAAPRFHPALYHLALVALQVNKLPLAADLMQQAAALAPDNAGYQTSLCEVFRRIGRLDHALAAGQQAVTIAPDHSDAWYNFGLALTDAGQTQQAASAYRRAIMMDPKNGLAANNLGALLERGGDIDGAEKSYAQAVSINPKHFEAQNNLGAILCARGNIEAAKNAFQQAIFANPSFVHAHYNLSSLKKYTPDDPHLAALENILQKHAASMSDNDRTRLFFALGKAREDTGQYDAAFAAYAEGNRLKRRTINYDESVLFTNTEAIIANYTPALAKTKKGTGCQDPTPIFVLGMPRSGTTLTEQILCSHPDVAGAGEVTDFSDALREISGLRTESDYTGWLAGADDETLKRLGENYIARLRRHAPGSKFITDKMPGNYYFIGIIHKALPQAKIIHTPREPMDTCLSNFTRLFNETMPFAYDLPELGRYHRNYERMMAHWHAVLPKDRILDMQYEDTVADQEGQTRRLLAHCSLAWDDACLDFHKNERLVKTASIAQVRKPIYKTSVARWENFSSHLAPLRQALDGTTQPPFLVQKKETAVS